MLLVEIRYKIYNGAQVEEGNQEKSLPFATNKAIIIIEESKKSRVKDEAKVQWGTICECLPWEDKDEEEILRR